jgi:hypothetical protein
MDCKPPPGCLRRRNSNERTERKEAVSRRRVRLPPDTPTRVLEKCAVEYPAKFGTIFLIRVSQIKYSICGTPKSDTTLNDKLK